MTKNVYTRLVQDVTAIKYTDENFEDIKELWGDMLDCTGHIEGTDECAIIVNNPHESSGSNDLHNIFHKGYWVVQHDLGFIYPITDEVFVKTYGKK